MRRPLALAALALSALLLAGCSGGIGGASAQRDAGPMPAPHSESLDSQSAAGGELISPSRDVITTGEVSLVVDDPTASAEKATRLVVAAGGHIDALHEQPAIDGRAASAMLTLRIPADRLDETLDEIKKLGAVQSVSLNRQDVTTEVKDVDARVKALQASVDRLTELMAKAASTENLIAIESALSERQAQLDSLLSQQKYLKDQVQLSTITLSLHQPGTAAAGGPTDFWGGLVAGWHALVSSLAAFVVGLGVALPWLVLMGLIAGITWLIVWASVRSRKRRQQ